MNGNYRNGNASILVVDDDEDVLGMLSQILRDFGYQVAGLSRSAEAIRHLERQSVDAVLTDVKMPEVTGLELLETVRARFPDIPVLLMTAHADMNAAVNAVKKGAFDFIMKPIDYDLLGHSLQKALQYQRFRRMEKKYQEELEETVKKRTQELTEAMRELQKARDAALETSQLKSEFLSTISQELRTPMNSVLGMIELLSQAGLNSEQRDYLQTARTAALSMVKVVDRIIQFTIMKAEKAEVREIPFSLRHIIDVATQDGAAKAQQKCLRLITRIDDAVPELLVGDPGRLSQLITCVFENAVKFTEQGEIETSVTVGEQDADGLALQVSIRDTGAGIPPERQAVIFDVFTQADGSMNRKYPGAGLGLSIAKKLAELLGGRIWCENASGAGSVFTFTVRVKPEQ